jgi:hypothetical protein
MIAVSRTLMKSEPELAELVEAVDGVEVTMAEKGFGTRVEVRAREGTGLAEADLEAILDRLAEPQRQPFGSVGGAAERTIGGDRARKGSKT